MNVRPFAKTRRTLIHIKTTNPQITYLNSMKLNPFQLITLGGLFGAIALSGCGKVETASTADSEPAADTSAPGQSYDLEFTSNLPAGEYNFVCDPHTMLGMKGKITVTP